MRGVFTATVEIAGIAAAKTLIYVTMPANIVGEILSAYVTNESNETNEQLQANVQRIGTLGTPTGTALTPSKHEKGDQASAATAVGNVTASEPTYTANTTGANKGFPTAAGWAFEPVPEERFYIQGGESVGLRMIDAPTSFNCIATITWREIG